jgi:hypothetical protein
MRVRATIAGALLAIAFSTASASGAATRAEYIAQVDPICQGAIKDGKAALLKATQGHPGDRRARGQGIVRKYTIFLKARFQILAVDPAPGDEQIVHAWTVSLGKAFLLGQHYGRALRGGSQTDASATAKKLKRKTNSSAGIVAGFGFSSCDDF